MLQGKNFRKFHSFVAICKSFLHKIWGVVFFLARYKQAIHESLLSENHIFHQFAKVFSLNSFPLENVFSLFFAGVKT